MLDEQQLLLFYLKAQYTLVYLKYMRQFRSHQHLPMVNYETFSS